MCAVFKKGRGMKLIFVGTVKDPEPRYRPTHSRLSSDPAEDLARASGGNCGGSARHKKYPMRVEGVVVR